MKILLALLLLVFTTASLEAATNAVPEMTIKFPLNKDPRPWILADSFTNGPVGSVLVISREWVVKGDSVDTWKEMFDEKAILTKDSVRKHVDIWKTMLAQVDAKAEVKEEKGADGTITVAYSSIAANEMGITRYFRASDGIYSLSYRAHPISRKEETVKIWREIIASATLHPLRSGGN